MDCLSLEDSRRASSPFWVVWMSLRESLAIASFHYSSLRKVDDATDDEDELGIFLKRHDKIDLKMPVGLMLEWPLTLRGTTEIFLREVERNLLQETPPSSALVDSGVFRVGLERWWVKRDGKILPRYPDGKLRYVNGETRVLAIDRFTPFVGCRFVHFSYLFQQLR
ncbi:hypothetical protein NE237_032498 [Protea cynaroides]|uniref:Uncharacterized protein n=1 Tax=Protea cynaroides TaxID=273540 RepID=A0A9Q0L448_9MAGN|nr:hypothetical protein NE237_032498 [Protea cynaroides]